MADELSRLAEQIDWPRYPELKEFEQMADTILSAGYYSAEELADTSSTERQQLYKISSGGRAGRARLARKILDAKAPPPEVEIKKSPPFSEVNIFGAEPIHACVGSVSYCDLGEKLRTASPKLCSKDPKRFHRTRHFWLRSYGVLLLKSRLSNLLKPNRSVPLSSLCPHSNQQQTMGKQK